MIRGFVPAFAFLVVALPHLAQAQGSVGPELVLDQYNSSLTRIDTYPGRTSVAADGAGGFVAAWSDTTCGILPQSCFANSTSVRRFRGGQLEPVSGFSGGQPALASDSHGELVLAWSDIRTSDFNGNAAADIFARRFSAEGAAQGSSFDVSLVPGADPMVARSSSGPFVVLWGLPGPGSPPGLEPPQPTAIWAALYDRDGTQAVSPFAVSAGDGEINNDAKAAMDDAGNFIVVWTHRQSNNADHSDVVAQRFNSSGMSLGDRIVVSSPFMAFARAQGVAVLPSGGFVVALVKADSPTVAGDVFARAYGSNAEPLDGEFRVNDTATNWGSTPRGGIAFVGSDVLAIAWDGIRSGQLVDTYVRLLNGNGVPKSDEMAVHASSQNAEYHDSSVAADGAGHLVVVARRIKQGESDLSDVATVAQRFRVSNIGFCVPSATRLCLNGTRFEAQVEWTTPGGKSGSGQAVSLTPDTGYFWFFNSSNVEMVVKVLDACSVFQRFWVFAGGLTNVQVAMTVTDTSTGAVHIYGNPQGQPFQPIQDTGSFATCP